MIIDLIEEKKSDFSCRYNSDVCPKVGEMVTLFQSTSEVKEFSAVILSCDHLIGPTVGSLGELREKLVTCIVKII